MYMMNPEVCAPQKREVARNTRWQPTRAVSFRVCLGALLLALGSLSSFAVDPDATSVVTAATTGFGLVATLAISIATFGVVLRLVKKFSK